MRFLKVSTLELDQSKDSFAFITSCIDVAYGTHLLRSTVGGWITLRQLAPRCLWNRTGNQGQVLLEGGYLFGVGSLSRLPRCSYSQGVE